MKEKIKELLIEGLNISDIKKSLNITEYSWRKNRYGDIRFYNNIFKEINSTSAYWLGFIWADGSLSGNTLEIEISTKDINHAELFASAFELIRKPSIFKRIRNNSETVRVILTDKEISKSLKSVGFSCKLKRVGPKIPEIFMPDFIRGYFDGDGSCVKRKSEYRADISGNIELINYILKYLNTPDRFDVVNNKTWTSKRIYWTNKKSVIEFFNKINFCDKLKLTRKYTECPIKTT